MGSLKILAMAGAVLASATAVASAADLRYPPPVLPAPPLAAPIAEASGWYLRGDIGVGAVDGSKPRYSDNPAGVQFHSPEYSAQIYGGVGVGYQFNSWLRFDVTGEYRGRFGGGRGFTFHDQYSLNDGVTTFTGTNKVTGSFTAAVLLANAYLDLGTWNGFTPFIGAGVGVANKSLGSVKDYGYANAFTNATGVVTNNSFVVGSAASKSTSSFAWALMAGVGFDVSPNYKVEVGYRYLNLGKVESGVFACGGCTYSIGAKDVDSHELRVGMRYMFGAAGYTPAPYPAEPPRVIKKF